MLPVPSFPAHKFLAPCNLLQPVATVSPGELAARWPRRSPVLGTELALRGPVDGHKFPTKFFPLRGPVGAENDRWDASVKLHPVIWGLGRAPAIDGPPARTSGRLSLRNRTSQSLREQRSGRPLPPCAARTGARTGRATTSARATTDNGRQPIHRGGATPRLRRRPRDARVVRRAPFKVHFMAPSPVRSHRVERRRRTSRDDARWPTARRATRRCDFVADTEDNLVREIMANGAFADRLHGTRVSSASVCCSASGLSRTVLRRGGRRRGRRLQALRR